jgi:hypothetical protein
VVSAADSDKLATACRRRSLWHAAIPNGLRPAECIGLAAQPTFLNGKEEPTRLLARERLEQAKPRCLPRAERSATRRNERQITRSRAAPDRSL